MAEPAILAKSNHSISAGSNSGALETLKDLLDSKQPIREDAGQPVIPWEQANAEFVTGWSLA